jgi:hypothetical protein
MIENTTPMIGTTDMPGVQDVHADRDNCCGERGDDERGPGLLAHITQLVIGGLQLCGLNDDLRVLSTLFPRSVRHDGTASRRRGARTDPGASVWCPWVGHGLTCQCTLTL